MAVEARCRSIQTSPTQPALRRAEYHTSGERGGEQALPHPPARSTPARCCGAQPQPHASTQASALTPACQKRTSPALPRPHPSATPNQPRLLRLGSGAPARSAPARSCGRPPAPHPPDHTATQAASRRCPSTPTCEKWTSPFLRKPSSLTNTPKGRTSCTAARTGEAGGREGAAAQGPWVAPPAGRLQACPPASPCGIRGPTARPSAAATLPCRPAAPAPHTHWRGGWSRALEARRCPAQSRRRGRRGRRRGHRALQGRRRVCSVGRLESVPGRCLTPRAAAAAASSQHAPPRPRLPPISCSSTAPSPTRPRAAGAHASAARLTDPLPRRSRPRRRARCGPGRAPASALPGSRSVPSSWLTARMEAPTLASRPSCRTSRTFTQTCGGGRGSHAVPQLGAAVRGAQRAAHARIHHGPCAARPGTLRTQPPRTDPRPAGRRAARLLAAGQKVFERLDPRLLVVLPPKPHLVADLRGVAGGWARHRGRRRGVVRGAGAWRAGVGRKVGSWGAGAVRTPAARACRCAACRPACQPASQPPCPPAAAARLRAPPGCGAPAPACGSRAARQRRQRGAPPPRGRGGWSQPPAARLRQGAQGRQQRQGLGRSGVRGWPRRRQHRQRALPRQRLQRCPAASTCRSARPSLERTRQHRLRRRPEVTPPGRRRVEPAVARRRRPAAAMAPTPRRRARAAAPGRPASAAPVAAAAPGRARAPRRARPPPVVCAQGCWGAEVSALLLPMVLRTYSAQQLAHLCLCVGRESGSGSGCAAAGGGARRCHCGACPPPRSCRGAGSCRDACPDRRPCRGSWNGCGRPRPSGPPSRLLALRTKLLGSRECVIRAGGPP